MSTIKAGYARFCNFAALRRQHFHISVLEVICLVALVYLGYNLGPGTSTVDYSDLPSTTLSIEPARKNATEDHFSHSDQSRNEPAVKITKRIKNSEIISCCLSSPQPELHPSFHTRLDFRLFDTEITDPPDDAIALRGPPADQGI